MPQQGQGIFMLRVAEDAEADLRALCGVCVSAIHKITFHVHPAIYANGRGTDDALQRVCGRTRRPTGWIGRLVEPEYDPLVCRRMSIAALRVETTGPPRHVEQVPMAMLPLEGGGGTCLDGS